MVGDSLCISAPAPRPLGVAMPELEGGEPGWVSRLAPAACPGRGLSPRGRVAMGFRLGLMGSEPLAMVARALWHWDCPKGPNTDGYGVLWRGPDSGVEMCSGKLAEVLVHKGVLPGGALPAELG